MAGKAIVLSQPNIRNVIMYYGTSNVLFQPVIQNTKTYYSAANAYVKFYDTYRDSYYHDKPYYPYINFKGETYVKTKAVVKNTEWLSGSAFVSLPAPTELSTDVWTAYSNVLSSYIVNLGTFSTFEFDRVNSNIYKNIFSHIIFDVYSIQDKLQVYPYKKLNNIFQINHNFDLYDFVYIDKYGYYQKGIANSEETYAVVGMVYEIIDEHNFILMTNGIIDNPFKFESDSGVIYLSDINPGECTTYENISNSFYTPVGFHNDNKLIINILDSSVGDTLKLYQETNMTQNFARLSEQDINDIIQEVLNNS